MLVKNVKIATNNRRFATNNRCFLVKKLNFGEKNNESKKTKILDFLLNNGRFCVTILGSKQNKNICRSGVQKLASNAECVVGEKYKKFMIFS